MWHLLVYILMILGINIAFAHTPLIALPGGELWPPLSLAVGFVFVVRDYAQRRVGHHILWGMLIGCALSWYFATPKLAIASAAAFALGEIADWLVFTFTKRKFSERILLSSLLGAPIDSLVFLLLVGIATPMAFVAMTLSKLVGAFMVYCLVKRREGLLSAQDGA